MGRIVGTVLAACALSLASGCANLYTRFPTTNAKIEQVYQSSRQAAGLSIIVAFPQMMSDVPGQGYMWENIFTVPLGCLCLCDAVCEAAIDTVCLPFDWPISAKRKRDQEAWQEERRREYEANRKKEEEEVN